MPATALGLIGLGLMGHGIGKNLLAKGFPVAVYDVDPAAAGRLVELGATAARSPKEVAERAEIVITVLPDGPHVEETVNGREGLLSGAKPGLLLMDCSTIDPAVTERVRATMLAAGGRMVDAAMTLGPEQAEQGNLIMLVGATDADYAVVEPVLTAFSQKIIRAGGPGAGIALKLVNNLLMLSIYAADVEALVLGAKAGLKTEVMLDLLTATAADNAHLRRTVPNQVLKGDYEPGFRVTLAHKDLGLAQNMAGRLGVPLFALNGPRQLYTLALAEGKGNRSFQVAAQVLEGIVGVSLAED
ncbi:MAG: NAD(P)-dependent oxidoreductase [Dehalococcoidales bacterium]|nr:NAD(P)-dependent oxidoreductase [Dehalococcoidales bacterium]